MPTLREPIERRVPADGSGDGGEAAWLRGAVFAGGVASERGRRPPPELKVEATRASPESDPLHNNCVG
jgi:hypothetical protein